MDSLLGGVFVIVFARAILSPVLDQLGYRIERRRLRRNSGGESPAGGLKGSQIGS